MDEVYGSLAYDGALLLRISLCISSALLVPISVKFACVFCDQLNSLVVI